MSQELIKTKSTQYALIGKYIKNTLLMVGGAYLAAEAYDLMRDLDPSLPHFLCSITSIGSAITSVLNGWELLGNPFQSKRKITINPENLTFKEESQKFPGRKYSKTTKFNEVLETRVEQSPIDRITNTGTLKIRAVVYTNSEAKEIQLKVPYISNPSDIQEKIEPILQQNPKGLEQRI